MQLTGVKGFTDIRELIQNSGTPIHCSELMGIPVLSNGEEVIDEQAHPTLGRHLSHSINTGTFCSYEPEKAVDWIV